MLWNTITTTRLSKKKSTFLLIFFCYCSRLASILHASKYKRHKRAENITTKKRRTEEEEMKMYGLKIQRKNIVQFCAGRCSSVRTSNTNIENIMRRSITFFSLANPKKNTRWNQHSTIVVKKAHRQPKL